MQWFENARLKQKLLISFTLIMILIITTGLAAHFGLRNIQISQDIIAHQELPVINKLMELNMLINRQRAYGLESMFPLTPLKRNQILNILAEQQKNVELLISQIAILEKNNSHTIKELDTLRTLTQENQKTRIEANQLFEAGKTQEALNLMTGIQVDRVERLRLITNNLINQAQIKIENFLKDTQATSDKITYIFLGLSLLTIIILLALIFILNRTIAQPLSQLSEIAEKISLGDLDIEYLKLNRKDEVGILSSGFVRMGVTLQTLAQFAKKIAEGDLTIQIEPLSAKDVLGHSFKSMVNSLHYFSREIQEGIRTLTSSVSQISVSSSQLTSSAAETATAVSETTSTIEEVRQTSEISSQKAKLVSEAAQEIVKISEEGKSASDQTTIGMTHIRDQMSSIAQNMVKLSEQTQAITTIISVVDDLAQQSNLLAVNASIEAEKAGEQGRGFRIVAQEIKSLADQSKQATHRIRDLLSDIQKATTTTVLATETGTKVVESGTKLAAVTTKSITHLTDRIIKSVDSAVQIATSSHEQLIGMEQAATAMENIKQASLQNVESARQLETAAQNLQELGFKLHQIIKQYKLKSEQAHSKHKKLNV